MSQVPGSGVGWKSFECLGAVLRESLMEEILSLWQHEAGLWETLAREQRDPLKLAAAPQVSPGRNSQNIVGKLFCQIPFWFCFCKKKNPQNLKKNFAKGMFFAS